MALFWGEGASASSTSADERRTRRGRARDRVAGRTEPGLAKSNAGNASRRAEHPAMTWLSSVATRLTGLGALIVATILAAVLLSYDAADPSLLTATGRAPTNWLGAPGAMLADPLMQGLGLAAWSLVALFAVWGWRLAMARGDERFWGRLVTMPPAIGAAAIFAALHAPWQGWPPGAGLGGVLGDRGAAALLHSIPLPAAEAFVWLAGGAGAAMLILGALALGVSLGEARAAGGWMLGSLTGLGQEAARGAASGAAGLRDRLTAEPEDPRPRSERLGPARPTGRARRVADAGTLSHSIEGARADRARHAEDDEAIVGAETIADAAPAPAAERSGMITRLAGLGAALNARRGASEADDDPEGAPAKTDTYAGDAKQEPSERPRGLRAFLAGRRSADAAEDRPAPGTAPAYPGRGPEPVLSGLGPASAASQPNLANTIRALRAAPEEGEGNWDDSWSGAGAGEDTGFHRSAASAPGAEDHEGWDGEDDILPEMEDMPASRAAPGDGRANPLASIARAASSRRQPKPQRSRRAEAESQPSLFAAAPGHEPYEAPALALLAKPVAIAKPQQSQSALEENARMLETVLEDYGVRGEIVAVKPGPVVTLYELEPAPGLKASRVIGLADDIARSMSALSARIATVPGRSVIGIELPNVEREKVWLRETLESRPYGDARYPLALALGKDIEGEPVIANLAKMPHLLIAGTTGSGKSVAINTMILSLLYRLSPDQCRVIMIDPKMLELSVYDNIPHLLAPVVTDPKKAVVALKWVVAEMEERYRRMSKLGVRNIDGYNARCRDTKARGELFSRTIQTGFDQATGEPIYETQEFEPEEMPLIVVIVDEMADLMMVAGKEIEACIQRLAQMARASGIHLIMATQRPSVDVITGTIKANFPTRISFQVTSKIDSRTILGEQGAEQLLGQGDMLYMAGGGRITRVHGPFVSDEEVEEVVRHLKSLGQPDYVTAVTEGADDETQSLVDEKLGLAAAGDGDDALYDKAVAIVARDRKCSTSYIQRKLAIGYNKAARLVEMMEDQGVVTPANAVGKRDILVEER
ncbi:MAG: DNA translocase FtsK 4TM domain-containing protein [Pseudomonadota bacterium]